MASGSPSRPPISRSRSAIAGARNDYAVDSDTIVIGEIGLGGEIRQVPQAPRRLTEALRLGFRRAIVPLSTPDVRGVQLCRVGDIHEALVATDLQRRGSLRFGSDREDLLAQGRSEVLYAALRLVAPGTPLREGIDRILQAKMGALIVVGDGPAVLNICSGGFLLDAEFTPQRLSELAKMDGAIILASDGTRVARANVHLVPDPDIPTNETGTRHRTAERVARQISVPVITVSEEMGVVSVHYQGNKQTLDRTPRVLARADQALQILGRYKSRLDGVTERAVGARGRRPRNGPRCRHGVAARGDGAAYRGGDRGLRRRARPRRSPRRAPARGAHRWCARRSAPGGQGLLRRVAGMDARAGHGAPRAHLRRRVARSAGRIFGAAPPDRARSRFVAAAARLSPAQQDPAACRKRSPVT